MSQAPTGAGQGDSYLGFLAPIDDFQIFGYCTSTQIKFVAVADDRLVAPEGAWRAFFAAVHSAYVEYMLNPCSLIPPADGGPQPAIASPKFRQKLDAAVEGHLEKAARPPPPAAPQG